MAPTTDWFGVGFVNFVDSQLKPESQEPSSEDEGDDGDEGNDDETYGSIEGFNEKDLGWTKIADMMSDASFYDISSDFAYGGWEVFYDRPSALLLYQLGRIDCTKRYMSYIRRS